MNINFNPELTADLALVTPRQTWDLRLAHFCSDLLNPPLITALGVLLLAGISGGSWGWAAAYILLVIGLPTLYVVRLVQSGQVSGFHLPIRQQRIKPLVFAWAISGLAWLALVVGSAPPLLATFAGLGFFQAGLMLLITLYWKISGHAMAIAGFAVFLLGVLGWPAAPALLLIPIVIWARLRTASHSLNQTLAGSLAGAAFVLALLVVL